MQIINHVADFSSLGGVQSYIYGLCNKYPKSYRIYNSGSEVLDIYKNNSIEYKKLFSLKFLFSSGKQIFILHNLILSKKWIFIFLLLKIKRNRIIYHEHGTAWSNPKKNKSKYIKRLLKIDSVIVNSNATKYLINSFYKAHNRLIVLRSPIFIYENIFDAKDLVRKNNQRKKASRLKIGFIGRLALHKNPLFLIELALLLKEKYEETVELQFVGSGPERKSLQIYCKEKKIDAKFWGRVQDRREVLSDWEYCIVPSIREPLGLIPGEMALQNILTFSSKVDGLQELYPIDCNYLLIDMKKNNNKNNANIQYLPNKNDFGKNFYPDIKQCAEKIINLKNNKDQYNFLLTKHKEYIENNFDIKNHSRDLRKFIMEN